MAEKKKSSPKRAEARAASRRRGEARHDANALQNSEQEAHNRLLLAGTAPVVLSSVRTTYGVGAPKSQYGKRKRPSKVLRAVRRAQDPIVAAKRKAHATAS